MGRNSNLLIFLCCTLPLGAAAHKVGLSRGEYRVDGKTVSGQVAVATKEADAEKFFGGIAVSIDGKPCPGTLIGHKPVENDGVEFLAHWICPHSPGKVAFQLAVFGALAPGHRHVASVTVDGQVYDVVLSETNNSFTVGEVHEGTFGELFVVGIEHIVFGWDHVIFVLALFLVIGSLKSYAIMITAFTVAHSVTLGLAVLGVWAPSGDLIEPIIALSIAWVGVENFIIKNTDRRWILTALFGLIHGFGFAGALAEVGLPDGNIPSMLLAFNLGVEAGQLAILLVAVPLLTLARKEPRFDMYGIRALNVAVIGIGTWWFIERVFLG